MGRGLARCTSCGQVQWSLLAAAAPKPCNVCGAEMRDERRRPGRRFGSRPALERRDTRPVAPA